MRRSLRPWLALCGALILGRPESARAKVYLSREEAAHLVFGEQARLIEERRALTPEARAVAQARLGRPVYDEAFLVLVAQGPSGVEGYGLVMEEMGKHEPITFFVAISPDGRVKDVLVLEYRESRGGEVRQKGFLRQYLGKTSADPLRLEQDITPITGATISARALSDGVKKALVIWETLYRTPS